MDFNTAISQILILFIIMFMGVAAKKSRILDKSVQDSISILLMDVALPALVLSSTNFERTAEVLPNMLSILMITVVSYILTILLCMLIVRVLHYEKKIANVFISLIVFANVGFMGYPVARAFFAEIGVFYTAVANLVFGVFLWTYGILLFNRQEKVELKKLLNLGSISSFIAILMFIFELRLPYPLFSALELTGKMTAPLSMLLIGAIIAEIDIAKLVSNKKAYLVSAIKLVLIPLTTAYILKLMGINSIVISICTLMAAMPSGATNAIFALQFDSEPLFASIGVFITTLLSIITLPLTVYVLTNFIL
ncbi:MAG TPA: AEC family transporter [Clostridia bacterium]|nr:AEC family transporter [Clostridia bacterium]